MLLEVMAHGLLANAGSNAAWDKRTGELASFVSATEGLGGDGGIMRWDEDMKRLSHGRSFATADIDVHGDDFKAEGWSVVIRFDGEGLRKGVLKVVAMGE